MLVRLLQWRLYVADKDGSWRPKWEGGLIALVVCSGVILAVLLFILLLGRWVWQSIGPCHTSCTAI